MKKSVLFWMCASVIAMAAIAIAADEVKTDKNETPRTPRIDPQTQQRIQVPAGEAARGPANREVMYKEMLARRTEAHRAEMAKIEAIVKIAESEKATKTVEALKALIAEQDKEFNDQIQKAELRRVELSGAPGQRPGVTAPATAGQVRSEAEKQARKDGEKKAHKDGDKKGHKSGNAEE